MPEPLFLIAFLGGVLPALLWLFFWLMEDRCEPEPKRYIFFCFLAGALVVWPIYYLERFFIEYATGALLLLIWAVAEEVAKFLAAYFVALRSHVFDEPLDAVVYLVTAALGFSAVENILFLLGPLSDGNTLQALLTGNLRFIGATLLHTLASATIGIAIALAYYKPLEVRRLALMGGIVLAIALHALFNLYLGLVAMLPSGYFFLFG
jgi:RsiW-degrading membrane proteinase PrsW (M82 family)